MSNTPRYSTGALFRYSVVSQVLARTGAGASRAEAIAAACMHPHFTPGGQRRRVSPRSLYRWMAAFDTGGIEGLEFARRPKPAIPALPADFVAFLIEEKTQDRPASIPEIIRRARERGILKSKQVVSRSTVYRACQRLGLPVARCRHAKDRDSRRFAHPHRMDMVLCDGKHFRAGPQRAKRVALFFLDDATRLVLHTVVGTSETKQLFLRGLYECIHKHGLMDAVFVDNGPGFVAEDTLTVFANLGILLIHGEAGYKEGHGKVERFNRTAKADVLRGLDGSGDVDPDCGALELRLLHYTEQRYAHRPHEGLDGDTPRQRFDADAKALRFPACTTDLRSKFEVHLTRRVADDHVISIDSVHYEVPRGHAGQLITVRRRVLDGTIVLRHEDSDIVLHAVDLASNARSKRAKGRPPCDHDEDGEELPTTAADIAFQRDFRPVVDAHGGFAGGDDALDSPDREQTP
jgi:transposase InsO family protein